MPEGFDDITTEENSPVDLYYHDEYLGSHIATFDDDYFYFNEPKSVLDKLLFIQHPEIVLKELSKKLDPNIELACNDVDKSKCTFIEPKVVGIILDRGKYRAYLYINYKYLKPARLPSLDYLEYSKAPLGMSAKRTLFSKSIFDQDSQTKITTFNLNSTDTISKGNFEMNLESIVSFGFNEQMDSQDLPIYKLNSYIGRYRKKRSQLSFGTANTYGSFLIPSQNLLGVILETDKTLVKNPDIQYGTPIQVNVNDPSVVEVRKGNTIIFSKFFPPGNYFIDTKSFPSGVYNIQVNVSSLYGKTKTTNRVFIKKDDYPALGEHVYAVGVGFLPDFEAANESYFPTYHKDRGVFYGSYAKRLSKRISANISTISDIKYSALSIGLSNFGSIYQVDLAGLIASDKGYGGSVSMAINFWGLSIITTAKHIHDMHSHTDKDLIVTNPLDMLKETVTNYNIVATYSYMNNSIILSYDHLYYSCGCKPKEYEFNANYSRPLFNTMSINSTISCTYMKSNSGYSILAGVSMQISGKSIDHSTSLLAEKPVTGDRYKQNLNYTLKYKLNDDLSMSATANVKREPTIEVKQFSKQLESSYLGEVSYNKWNIQAQVLANHLPDHSYGYFYNLSATSNWGCAYSFGNGFVFTKNNSYNSAVFLRINAPVDNASFSVTFDYDENCIVKANKNYNFGLSPFKFHKIQVTSKGEDNFYKIDGIPDRIFLYPGNIFPVTLVAKEFFVLMTVITDVKGEPITNASISLGEEFDNSSDEFGEIQIDVSHGDRIKVTYDENEKTCHFTVPNQKADGGILMIDQIVCN